LKRSRILTGNTGITNTGKMHSIPGFPSEVLGLSGKLPGKSHDFPVSFVNFVVTQITGSSPGK